MAKIIRPAYPREFAIGFLLLIFILATILSFEILTVKWQDVMDGNSQVFGMLLSGLAVVFVALILWEEFLFPVRVKPTEDEIVFRNHFTKLQTQVLIYFAILIIVAFVYFNYEVSPIPFFIWAALCLVSPVVGKLASGLKNYNDFLKITADTIEYRNNAKEGVLRINDIQEIILVKDEENVLHKLKVRMQDGSEVIIDLDEMELDEYYQTIEKFITGHYTVGAQ